MTNLEVTSEARGEVWIIHLKGFLDAHSHVLFRDAVREHVEAGRHRLVVDFADLVYIGSSGIEVILANIQPLRDNGGDMVLCCMSQKIFKVFDLLGLPSLFVIRDSVEEAVGALHG
jgi:anti-sigma B factor antagonist